VGVKGYPYDYAREREECKTKRDYLLSINDEAVTLTIGSSALAGFVAMFACSNACFSFFSILWKLN
jgi:hypothetical protein